MRTAGSLLKGKVPKDKQNCRNIELEKCRDILVSILYFGCSSEN